MFLSVSASHFCVSIKKYFHHYINSRIKSVFRFEYLVWLWIYFLCIHISNSEIKKPFRYFGNDFRKLIFGSLTFNFWRIFFGVSFFAEANFRFENPDSFSGEWDFDDVELVTRKVCIQSWDAGRKSELQIQIDHSILIPFSD